MRSKMRAMAAVLTLAAMVPSQGHGGGGGGGGGGGSGGNGGSGAIPAGAAIVYVDGDLEVMTVDGTASGTVLAIGKKGFVRFPTWSADDSRYAVAAKIGQNTGIYVVMADGSASTMLVPYSGNAHPSPDWSPTATADGWEKIAFDLQDPTTGNKDIWICNPDGSGLTNLTGTPYVYETDPCFSRDGTHLAFVRDASEIVVVDLGMVNGQLGITAQTVVHQDPNSIFHGLAWANTQDLLAFSQLDLTVSFTMRLGLLAPFVTPSAPIYLTNSDGDERSASFAPDDSAIAFQRGGSAPGIYVMELTGMTESRIRNTGYDPCWRH